MESGDLQQIFFLHLKDKIPENISLADEIADTLKISIDGAYRRIRGEKLISFEEMQQLALKYKISIDYLLTIKQDTFSFTGKAINSYDFNYEKLVGNIITALEKTIEHEHDHHLFFLPKEIPFFYYCIVPEIAAFKSFYLLKVVFDDEKWRNKKFSINDNAFNSYKKYWEKLARLYANIPSTEIWSLENITSTINQIELYRAAGDITSNADALMLLEKTEELIKHVELQAECGIKLNYSQQPDSSSLPQFNMYVNEMVVGDNTILTELGNTKIVYMAHNSINYIFTDDVAFTSYIKKMFDRVIQKSNPIHTKYKNDRLAFFNKLKNRIAVAKHAYK